MNNMRTIEVGTERITFGFTQEPDSKQDFKQLLKPFPVFFINTSVSPQEKINIRLLTETDEVISNGLEPIGNNSVQVETVEGGTQIKFISCKIAALSKMLVVKLLQDRQELKELEMICKNTKDEEIQSVVKPFFDTFKSTESSLTEEQHSLNAAILRKLEEQKDTTNLKTELDQIPKKLLMAKNQALEDVSNILFQKLKDKEYGFLINLTIDDVDRERFKAFYDKLQGPCKISVHLFGEWRSIRKNSRAFTITQ